MSPEALRAALDQAIGGDPARALAALGDPATGAEARLALRAVVARMDPSRAARPAIDEVRSVTRRDRAAGALAAALLARDAVARLDGDAIVAAGALAVELAGGGGDERAALEAEQAQAWSLLARGPTAGLREQARALEARAARSRAAHLVIDAAALAALAALTEGDLVGALGLARRASRMARTESMPQEEYLANVVLARVRRHAGRPHLATRIVAALARVAPPAWQGWLALELELAGARDVAARALARAEEGPAASAASSLSELVSGAIRGERALFDEALRGARAASRSFAPIAAELEQVARAIDPAAAIGAGGDLAAFLAGRSDALPGWLAGPASIPRAGEAHALVRAIASPDAAPRRVLAIGLPLAAGAIDIGREAGAKQHRRETALAILALAGPEGIAKDELFRAVWGFAFAPHLHQGVLDVLLHRVRAALGEAGELTRRESRIALAVRRTIAVADPRAEQPLDDRVLALVSARGGAARARELAQALDVPLRTVQAALGRLVEGGDCLREGEGQNVAYRVEDTTFREPTVY